MAQYHSITTRNTSFKTVISLDLNLRAPGVLGDLQAAMRRGEVTRELWEIYASRKLTSTGEVKLAAGAVPVPTRRLCNLDTTALTPSCVSAQLLLLLARGV